MFSLTKTKYLNFMLKILELGFSSQLGTRNYFTVLEFFHPALGWENCFPPSSRHYIQPLLDSLLTCSSFILQAGINTHMGTMVMMGIPSVLRGQASPMVLRSLLET